MSFVSARLHDRGSAARKRASDPATQQWTPAEVIELIGQLYAVERESSDLPPGPPDELRADVLRERGTRRADRSAPILTEIRGWAQRQRALPESSLTRPLWDAVSENRFYRTYAHAALKGAASSTPSWAGRKRSTM